MSLFRRAIIMAAVKIAAVADWFRSDGYFRSEAW